MIVDAPTDSFISTSLSVVTNSSTYDIQIMPITEAGSHIKLVIAAKFNYSAPSGWPVLQILRRIHTSLNLTVIVMTQLELRPTGYLNVFEYHLSVDVQSGDLVRILQDNIVAEHGQRYILAYQTTPFQLQVSYVNVSDDSACFTLPSTDSTSILSTTYVCKPSTTKSFDSPINTIPNFSINETFDTTLFATARDQPVV